VSQRKGDPVAPPAIGTEWKIRFSTNEAAKGWQELENQATGNLRKAWETMRTEPGPGPGRPTPRHHPLKGALSTGTYGGRSLPQWQLEVTGGGRIWYLLDEQRHTVWVQKASTGHPKETE
jgi:hypothetical protein